MKKVTLIPCPSWIEYLLTLKISPFIKKDLFFNRVNNLWKVNIMTNRKQPKSEIVEHEATIESSAKALHHELIFQFCDHLNT